ncbi:YggT family protein [Piscicoccus intestinalis]|uniref:YggT family protein n=1 Tax=Piscicoccus intestinalis TaxID=746033 RepID=UPI0008393B92|nr:YggT family protein [Piscicoccus intestinalis]
MNPVIGLLVWLINVYIMVLIGRLIIDWIQVFARDWRPRGVLAVICEAVYTVTDPPLRALRRVIPPIRLGGVALDLSFIVLIIGLSLLTSLLNQIGR